MMLLMVLFSYWLTGCSTGASLVSNNSVACPGETVLFTCTQPGTSLRWRVDPPAESGLMSVQSSIFIASQVGRSTMFGEEIRFEATLVSSEDGIMMSTLINLSEVYVLNGSIVTCATSGGAQTVESHRTILSAVAPSPPLNVRVSFTQNQSSTSLLTLFWCPASSTGGVSINYVLTISPPPLSGSAVATETTFTQIIVSYNTLYNVTIRAVNCAGTSDDTLATIPSIVACPSDPPPASRVSLSNTPPPPALLGSTLSFTCNGQTISATCESDGRWSPNPSTYECLPPICTVPDEPSGGSIVYMVDGATMNYERLDETVEETTALVLTYQCDCGLSLTGPNTITCTNAGVWSTDPQEIMCIQTTTTTSDAALTWAPLFTGATVAISVGITFIVTLVIGIFIGLLVMYLCVRKKAVYSLTAEGQANVGPTAPAGPVYEEVSLKEEIELKKNKAYGPVGL